jgi:hypothetical protein
MSLSESINNIKTHIYVAESELNSLLAGKKASASRVRKSLQEIKKLSHALRKAIVEHLKTLPTKKRALSPINLGIPKPTPENMGDRPIDKPTPENMGEVIDKPTPENMGEPMTIVLKRKRILKPKTTM